MKAILTSITVILMSSTANMTLLMRVILMSLTANMTLLMRVIFMSLTARMSLMMTAMVLPSPLCECWGAGRTCFGITWNYWTSIIVFDGQLSGSNQTVILGDYTGRRLTLSEINCGNMDRGLKLIPFCQIPSPAQTLSQSLLTFKCWHFDDGDGWKRWQYWRAVNIEL